MNSEEPIEKNLSDFLGPKEEPAAGSSSPYAPKATNEPQLNGEHLCAPPSDASPCLNISLGLTTGLTTGRTDDNADMPPPDVPPPAAEKTEVTPPRYSPIPTRPRQRAAHPGNASTPDEQQTQRTGRPAGESRGRNQLLPRYWPRITNQEIQQISGDPNAIITPLFEKVLSASDAGRIGRLVLPKACAEAYFPPISQPEGLPLKIKDMGGREWQFQFRYWPNNNSRMYVLEGVTPCIQAMRLQAGDTVTFSRLEPENKLVMGFRRASAAQDGEGTEAPVLMKESKYPSSIDYKAPRSREAQALLLSDKRRGRSLGGKTKRLRLETEESLEIKSSWEEAQELLRPPPGVTPSFVTIDGHQFEEYEEPPVLAKKTITRTKASGEKDRWVQCDTCTQFRKVPLDAFLHTRWTCADNIWDPKRAHCSAPRELTNEEIDQLLGSNNNKPEVIKQPPEVAALPETAVKQEQSGLEALADVAAADEAPPPPPPAPATTKHPRHRPGCTCIVCIQPPSGKGPKHKPSCVCNVCLTVKRRFKTLMMRRKKRQSEREAETAARKRKAWDRADVADGEDGGVTTRSAQTAAAAQGAPQIAAPPSAAAAAAALKAGTFMTERGKLFPFTGLLSPFPLPDDSVLPGKAQIDLNSQPEREDGQVKQHPDQNQHQHPNQHQNQEMRVSMMRLLQDASLPLDMYLKQQGMASLAPPPQQQQQQQQQQGSPS